MKSIIFCDIDGTILDGSRGMPNISEKTKYAFEELKKDSYVFISSGRCKGLLSEQVKQLKPNGFILCNGAYSEFEGQEIYSLSFTEKVVDKIKEVSLKYNGFYILETLDEMFVDSLESDAFKAFMSGWGVALSGFKQIKSDDNYHIAMIGFLNYDNYDLVEKELSDYVDLAAHHGFSSFDVNIENINKGYGVKRVLEYLNIPRDNAYCFGDGINDLEMLYEVGHPIIMANADEKIKGLGFDETDDVLDDGLYNYLVSHKLIKPL